MAKKSTIENTPINKEMDPIEGITKSFENIKNFQEEMKQQREKIKKEAEKVLNHCDKENKKIEKLINILDQNTDGKILTEVTEIQTVLNEIKLGAEGLKIAGDGDVENILEKLKSISEKIKNIDFSKLEKPSFSEVEKQQMENIKKVLGEKYSEEIGMAVKNKIHEWNVIDNTDYFNNEHQIKQAFEQTSTQNKNIKKEGEKNLVLKEVEKFKSEGEEIKKLNWTRNLEFSLKKVGSKDGKSSSESYTDVSWPMPLEIGQATAFDDFSNNSRCQISKVVNIYKKGNEYLIETGNSFYKLEASPVKTKKDEETPKEFLSKKVKEALDEQSAEYLKSKENIQTNQAKEDEGESVPEVATVPEKKQDKFDRATAWNSISDFMDTKEFKKQKKEARSEIDAIRMILEGGDTKLLKDYLKNNTLEQGVQDVFNAGKNAEFAWVFDLQNGNISTENKDITKNSEEEVIKNQVLPENKNVAPVENKKPEEKKKSVLKRFGKYIGATLIGLGLLTQSTGEKNELQKDESLSKSKTPEKVVEEKVSDEDSGKIISTEQVGGKTIVKVKKPGFFNQVEKPTKKVEQNAEVKKTDKTEKSNFDDAQKELAKTFLQNLIDLQNGRLKAPAGYEYSPEAPKLMNTKEYVASRSYVDKIKNQEMKNVFLNYLVEAKKAMEKDDLKGFENNIRMASDFFEGKEKNIDYKSLAQEKVKKEKEEKQEVSESTDWKKQADEKLKSEKSNITLKKRADEKVKVENSNLTSEEKADEDAYDLRSKEIDEESKADKEVIAKKIAETNIAEKQQKKYIEDFFSSIGGEKSETTEVEKVDEKQNPREFFEEQNQKINDLEASGKSGKNIKPEKTKESYDITKDIEQSIKDMTGEQKLAIENTGNGIIAKIQKNIKTERYQYGGNDFEEEFKEVSEYYKNILESNDSKVKEAKGAVEELENLLNFQEFINKKSNINIIITHNKNMGILEEMKDKFPGGEYEELYKQGEELGGKFSEYKDSFDVKSLESNVKGMGVLNKQIDNVFKGEQLPEVVKLNLSKIQVAAKGMLGGNVNEKELASILRNVK